MNLILPTFQTLVPVFLLFVAIVLSGCSQHTVTSGLEAGLAAHRRGDYATALKEYRPLAEQGDAMAQTNLGVMYERGHGVAQDYNEALRWYRKATEQKHAMAQYNLGVMYYNGRGVPKDYNEAVSWYRKAAEQGVAVAQNNLGLLYAKGRGVPQDYVLAHMWFNLAAQQGLQSALQFRATAEALLTPAQIEEAKRLASEWMAKKK